MKDFGGDGDSPQRQIAQNRLNPSMVPKNPIVLKQNIDKVAANVLDIKKE